MLKDTQTDSTKNARREANVQSKQQAAVPMDNDFNCEMRPQRDRKEPIRFKDYIKSKGGGVLCMS